MLDYKIHTFLTLCDTMNYRAAAERLNLTQPAVTQHIQRLEEEYGCRLFSYDGRRLTMTPEAALLRRCAHGMRYQEERLRQALLRRPGRYLSIGATKTIGEYVIGPQLARYLENPDNHIRVEVDNTANILAMLDRGALDFALIEGFFDRAAYGSRLFRLEPFVGLCGSGHPLAGRRVPLEALFGETLLLREEGSGTRSILEQLLAERNRSTADFARVTCIGNFGLLERLAAAGRGVTFAYAAAGAGNPALAEFYVEGWEVRREFNYVYLPDTDAAEAVDCFEAFRQPEG